MVALSDVALNLIGAVDAELLRGTPGECPALVPDVGLRPLEEILVLAEDREHAGREGVPGGRAEVQDVVAVRDARHAGELDGVGETVDSLHVVVLREERGVEAEALPVDGRADLPATAQCRTSGEMPLLLNRVAVVEELAILPGEVVGLIEGEALDERARPTVPGELLLLGGVRDARPADEATARDEAIADARQSITRAVRAARAAYGRVPERRVGREVGRGRVGAASRDL